MADIPPILSGVYCAVLTPMKADLTPDDKLMVRHCKWLLDQGCDGLSILGTTGEANSLCMKERIRTMDSLVEAGIDPARLMPGTGCCALTDTCIQTGRAMELGVGGVLMLPPFYYKNVSDDGLFASYSEVIQRVGSDRLRIYLYHFPQMSAVPISLSLIERLVTAYPDTVVGMKDSSGDLDNMLTVQKAFPDFAVFTGWDHLLKPLLAAGGAGCITAVANIAAPLLRRIMDGAPDADAAHDRIDAVRQAITARPLIPGLKEVMARHDGNPGWRFMRPPMVAVDDATGDGLMADIAATGFEIPAV